MDHPFHVFLFCHHADHHLMDQPFYKHFDSYFLQIHLCSNQIPVQIDALTTITLNVGGVLENKDVYNLDSIREFVKVEQDLSEIDPIVEGKTLLFD